MCTFFHKILMLVFVIVIVLFIIFNPLNLIGYDIGHCYVLVYCYFNCTSLYFTRT
jgi:hypothetical protein